MFTIIPQNGINEILAIIQGIIGDTMPFVIILSGIVLGLYILGGLFPKIDKENK
jgi:hypothetical protein